MIALSIGSERSGILRHVAWVRATGTAPVTELALQIEGPDPSAICIREDESVI